jgi:transposase InsO family protein
VSKFLHRIVDWDVSERMTSDRTFAALKMFTSQRKQGEGLTYHCDQGDRETDGTYEVLLKEHGFQLNINSVGAWYDNAPMASVLGTPHRELIHQRVYRTTGSAALRFRRRIPSVVIARRLCHERLLTP